MADFELIDGGNYRALPESVSLGESQTGKTRFECTFRLMGGKFDGRVVFADLYLSDAAAERTIESMKYCGCRFPGGDVTNTKGFGENEVQLVIAIEEWEGKERNKVKWVNALKREPRAAPDGNATDAIRDRLRGKIAKIMGEVPPAEIDDSDIPF